MKNIPLLFLVFFKLSVGFGQTPVLDSLKQEFAKAKVILPKSYCMKS
jgi:hypothetical protein